MQTDVMTRKQKRGVRICINELFGGRGFRFDNFRRFRFLWRRRLLLLLLGFRGRDTGRGAGFLGKEYLKVDVLLEVGQQLPELRRLEPFEQDVLFFVHHRDLGCRRFLKQKKGKNRDLPTMKSKNSCRPRNQLKILSSAKRNLL